jgi:hypothetical protein
VNKIFPSANEALKGIVKDGQLVAVGGFGLCGIPEALIEIASVGSRLTSQHGALLCRCVRVGGMGWGSGVREGGVSGWQGLRGSLCVCARVK